MPAANERASRPSRTPDEIQPEITLSPSMSRETSPVDAGFVTVAKVGMIPEGEGASFQVGERLVAVFNHNGQYLAIDDICPHMGASLGGGYLDEEGIVTCPWHAWRFRVRSGEWADNPRLCVDTFEVRVQGDEIQVRAKQ
jgi:nitrite reductase (NADH) small subunit/3-phenylpropionate/trans-cinnamate dioxygenase ferredoxin subunit